MRKIIWSERAKREFDHTYEFWTNHNKSHSYSEKLLDETLRKIRLIAENPKIGSLSKKKKLRRVLVLENYSISYSLSSGSIKIHSFFDNRRDPRNL